MNQKKLKRNQLPFFSIEHLLLLSFFLVAGTFFLMEYLEVRQLENDKADVSRITAASIERNKTLIDLRKGSDFVQVNLLRYLFYTDPPVKERARVTMEEEGRKNDINISRYENYIIDQQEQNLYDSLIRLRNENAENRLQLVQLIRSGKQSEALLFNSKFMFFSYDRFQQATAALADYVNRRDMQTSAFITKEFASTQRAKKWKTSSLLLALLIIGIMIVGIIRKLRKTSQRLFESEQKYRTIIERTTEIIETADEQGRLVSANNAFIQKLGYSKSEISSLRITDILAAESKHLYKLNPQKREFGEVITGIRKTLQAKDGKKILVEGSIILNYDNEQFKSSTAFLNDITEKVMLEKQLAVSEANYRMVFMSIPTPMWIYDPGTFQFVKVNPAAIKHYGYSEQELLAMTIMDIRPKEDIEKAIQGAAASKSEEFSYLGNYRHKKKSGELIEVDIYSSHVIYDEKKLKIVMAVDVTEKNRYEQKFTRAMVKVQEEERYEIGAELHDNVCQILTATQLRVGVIKTAVPPDSQKVMEDIEQYIKLATTEIRNLSHQLAPAFFDDTNLYDAFNTLLSSMNADNKFHIELYFDDKILRAPISQELKLNLYRILQEQLRNIVKYARATKINTLIKLQQNTLRMQIADNGVGFDTSKVKKGIGLANMMRRAAMFDGVFTIASSPGKGCDVSIEIPLAHLS